MFVELIITSWKDFMTALSPPT